ncbi:MAG TPA: zinc ribbon domain-containing protein [Flavobacteriaceae bacterium]
MSKLWHAFKKGCQRWRHQRRWFKSTMYYSHCFVDGNFTKPDITAVQMQEFVKEKLKEMKFPGVLAKYFAKGIPKLERWKNNS